MSKRLFVGNLSHAANEKELRTLFSSVGAVTEVRVIIDHDTGQVKGFGFVEMATDQGAADAIARFHGHELNGRNLVVNEARPVGGPARARPNYAGRPR